MTKKLKKISYSEVEKVVYDKDAAMELKENNESIYKADYKNSCVGKVDDDLVKIEVAMRKCRRVGVFE